MNPDLPDIVRAISTRVEEAKTSWLTFILASTTPYALKTLHNIIDTFL